MRDHKEAATTEWLFVENFSRYDNVVLSCGTTRQVGANLNAIEQTG
ncbi:hypothetical protein LHFGNBLO_000070 [Mesorhizobium sp. AR10]|nr:hypothetical protein [Mesorhizobium sp. AR10]UVK38784.1 hypothetical protein LHFGNBLO_000070 [Mesorhizobium sp. AR10]